MCGKHLVEALKIKSRSKIANGKEKNYFPTVTVEIPDVEDFTYIDFDNIQGKIEIPDTKYVVYKDLYRQGQIHLSNLEDMYINISSWYKDDFEDFDYTKDVLYASNNLRDIARWYLFTFLKLPKPGEDEFETGLEYENAYSNLVTQDIYDSIAVIFDFYIGNTDLETILDGKGNTLKELKDAISSMFETR